MTSKRDAEGKGAGKASAEGGGGDGGKSSGETGRAGDSKDESGRPSSGSSSAGAVEIDLHHARNHHLRWVVLGIVLGGLCVTQLGTIGQWVGVVLLVLAAWAAFRVVQTLRHPPGTLIVDGDRVSLPRGLCLGDPIDLDRGAIKAAYLLRKAVAWHQAAPVLVVETGDKVIAYPRDWFAAEADQRRVLDALLGERHLERPAEPAPSPPSAHKLPRL